MTRPAIDPDRALAVSQGMTRAEMDRALWTMVHENQELLAVVRAIWRREVEVRPCAVCGRPMDVPPAARARTTKQYCSGACNSKAHRLRLLQSEAQTA